MVENERLFFEEALRFKWILADKTLPEQNERVLVYYEDEIRISYFADEEFFSDDIDPNWMERDIFTDIKYWMKLPSKPN